FVYSAATAPKLKLLLKNDKLSDDISRNFNNSEWSEYPLTADKYMNWIAALPEDQQIVNLFLSMETFGEFLPAETGIFDFMRALPRFAAEKGINFMTPGEVCSKLKSVGELSVSYPISWADEARDVSAWMGNDLQREALDKLYSVAERVNMATDRRLKQDWEYLQSADHFFYMSTKNLADGSSHASFSPYDSPYSAFTNYMNVLADFIVRVEEQYPMEIENEELNSLLLTIRNQAQEIETLNKEVKQLRNNILNADDSNNARVEAPEAESAPKAKGTKAEKTASKAAKKTTKKK
ncbi:MAG: alpha-amylase, partial [Muribaculaceae bacterium]|nr:alpha-amylase [Muribaculaceae bacterium]